MHDDGAAPGLAATKRVTCEGLPTGRTDLIRNGELVGLLSSYYESERILRDPQGGQKLGADPAELADALAPRNGFRFSRGGGRHFDSVPGTAATNVVIEAADGGQTPGDLLAAVGDGIYIGRIWYTYPVNGFSSGDFTCTVIGDSYVIRDGKLAEPVKPNTLRINHNTLQLLGDVAAVGAERTATIVWMSDQITYAPEMAVRGVRFDEIGEFMDGV
jgi:PmbA protein